jgi:hypothetical protein
MPFISSFYSLKDETARSGTDRVYHNNSACRSGLAIDGSDRQPSAGGHRLCKECEKLNGQDAGKRW